MPRPRKKASQRVPGTASEANRGRDTRLIPQTQAELLDLRGDPDASRRFREAGGAGYISRLPHVDALLGGAMVIAMRQLKRLEEASADRKLDPGEARDFKNIVDSVTKLIREQREQQKQEALEDMDTETLMKQAKEAVVVLGG